MRKWVREGKCSRECFANHEGLCRALKEVPAYGECPFGRNDIDIRDQYADIEVYNSKKSLGWAR